MDNAAPDEMELKLARALANPDKKVRDKTIQTLHSYIKGSDFEDLEMMRLWKSLYFCLWLADKQDVQLELAKNLAELIHSCESEEQLYQFTSCFYRTIMREWGMLDYYRVNKFYSLLRLFLHETFVFLQMNEWDTEMTTICLAILTAEILEKKPNGPRLHMADIFLDELHKISRTSEKNDPSKDSKRGKKISKKAQFLNNAETDGVNTRVLMSMYKPWFTVLSQETDRSFRERVNSNLFVRYLEKFARENKNKNNDSTEGEITAFEGVNTQALQAQVFALASVPDEEWAEQNSFDSSKKRKKSHTWDPSGTMVSLLRKELYDLHMAFQKKTDVQFVDVGEIEKELEMGSSSSNFVSDPPKKKAKKDKDAQEKEKQEKKEEKQGSGKKKKLASSQKEPESEYELTLEENDETSLKSAKKQKVDKKPNAAAATEVTPDRSEKAGDQATPTEISESEKKKKKQEPYLAAKKFSGARAGYVFKRGGKGLGYYLDTAEQGKEKTRQNNERRDSGAGTGKKKGIRNSSIKADKAEKESPSDKKEVHFNSTIAQKKDYDKSVYALRTTKSPEQARKITPSKGAMKKAKK